MPSPSLPSVNAIFEGIGRWNRNRRGEAPREAQQHDENGKPTHESNPDQQQASIQLSVQDLEGLQNKTANGVGGSTTSVGSVGQVRASA